MMRLLVASAPLKSLLLAALTLAAAGCSREEPVLVISHDQAMADTQPRQVQVLKVIDQVQDGSGDNRDLDVSYWIRVRVLDGPGQGKLLLLPYDDWNVGKRPPLVGQQVVVAPADWVRRSPDSQGRPIGGWPNH